MSLSSRQLVLIAVAVSFVVLFWRQRNCQSRASNVPINISSLRDSKTADENGRRPFYPGFAKPLGSNYSRILVIPKMSFEKVDWINEQFPEVETAIYEVDSEDRNAKYTVPQNKGREAMAYLTYIIDYYDDLPDTVIFIHSHELAWHNNVLLDTNTATTIRQLRDDRVARQGYMNLRCHLDPGCPDWIHLDRAEIDFDKHIKPEEKSFSFELFQEMFPGHRPPPVLSQPCCAQFAVSRDRIRDNPSELYIHLRNWLLATPLHDQTSGRIFEYMWQYLFTRNAEYCPSMNACYCDGFGICFGSATKLDDWLKKLRKRELADEELRAAVKDDVSKEERIEISFKINSLNKELRLEKEEAYRRGKEEANRALERERLPKYLQSGGQ